MASPMPTHSSGWNHPPVAGETDEYGLQTKLMNCTLSLHISRFSLSSCRLRVPCMSLVGRQRLIQPRQ